MPATKNLGLYIIIFALVSGAAFSFPNLGGMFMMLPANSYTIAIACLGLALCLPTFFMQGQIKITPLLSATLLMMALLLATSAIQSLVGLKPEWIKYFLALIFYFVVTLAFVKSPCADRPKQILLVGAATAIVACFYSIYYVLGAKFYGAPGFDTTSAPALGVFQQPNVLGSLCAFGVACSLLLLDKYNTKKTTLIAYGSIALSCFVITYLLSRSAYLALALVLACGSYRLFVIGKKKALLTVLSLVVVAIIAGAYVSSHSLEMRRSAEEASTLGVRGELWQLSWEMAKEAPILGVGLGNFKHTFAEKQAAEYVTSGRYTKKNMTHPHNEPLLWLVEGGALFFAANLAIIFGLLVIYHRKKQITATELGLLLSLAVHNMTELPIHQSIIHGVIIFMALRILESERDVAVVDYSYKPKKAFAAASVCFCLVASAFFISNIYTIAKLFPIVNDEMTTEMRNAQLDALPNQLALKDSIEFYYYSGIHRLAIENNSEGLHDLFIEWAQKQPLSRQEEKTLFNLEETYRALGNSEKAEEVFKVREYYFPAEKE